MGRCAVISASNRHPWEAGQRVSLAGRVLEGRGAAGRWAGSGSDPGAVTQLRLVGIRPGLPATGALPGKSCSVCNALPAGPTDRAWEASGHPGLSPDTPDPSRPWLRPPRPWGWRGLCAQDPWAHFLPDGLLAEVPRVLLLWAPVSRLSPHFQGYEGLVEGGENIRPANWLSVSNIIQLVRPAALPAMSTRVHRGHAHGHMEGRTEGCAGAHTTRTDTQGHTEDTETHRDTHIETHRHTEGHRGIHRCTHQTHTETHTQARSHTRHPAGAWLPADCRPTALGTREWEVVGVRWPRNVSASSCGLWEGWTPWKRHAWPQRPLCASPAFPFVILLTEGGALSASLGPGVPGSGDL